LKGGESRADNEAVSIRTRLMLTALIVCGSCSAAGVLLVHQTLSASANQRAIDAIDAKVLLVEAMLEEEAANARTAAETLVESPTTVAMCRGPRRSTIDVWAELQLARTLAHIGEIQVLDSGGQVLERVGDPVGCDAVLTHPLIHGDLRRGVSSRWILLDDHLTHAALAPITVDDQRLGLVLASSPMPALDHIAERVRAQLALVVGDEVRNHTMALEVGPLLSHALASTSTARPHRVAVAGQRYFVQEVALDRDPAAAPRRLVVLDPADGRKAMSGAALSRLGAVAGVGLVVCWLALMLVTRAFTRPLRRLEAFARRAAAGEARPVTEHATAPEIAVVEDALNDWLRQQQRMRTLHEDEVREARDREIDRWIQGSTAPDEVSIGGHDLAVGSWRASEACGDLCTLLPGTNGSLWIALGTVATRGLRAGMLTTLLNGALEAAIGVAPGAPPSVVLRALDGLLARYTDRVGWEDTFACLRLVRLSPDGGVAYAGAHREMWLARADGSGCQPHDWTGVWTGVWTGLLDEADDPDGKLRLGPGDTLLLATHGLTAIQDESGRFLGSKGIVAILDESRGQPARVIRDRLMTRWTEWVCDPRGDATAVVVRRRTGAPADTT
jgi:serine phosphatase RsbU (regulator of sigma subunit)